MSMVLDQLVLDLTYILRPAENVIFRSILRKDVGRLQPP